MNKRKVRINASEVLSDIRSGMDDEGFMEKYNLTFRQLQSLFRKMIKGGYVSPLEMAQRLCITESQVTEAFDRVSKAVEELD